MKLHTVLILLLLCGTPELVSAADITLAWDPVTQPELAGYRIYYGSDSRQYSRTLDAGNGTVCTINNLDAGTYYFSVKAYGHAGQESPFSNEVMAVAAENPDLQSPRISLVGIASAGLSSAIISWKTDELSDSQVDYGPTAGYGLSTVPDPAMLLSHSQSITGLAPGTTYHYRVKSSDAAGNLAVSADFSFTTAMPADATAPVIDGVSASPAGCTGAAIVWTTSKASDSQVEYGTTASYGASTAVNSSLVFSHFQELTGLAAGTQHHYRVKSRDTAGNLAVSADFTFTTSKCGSPPSISEIAISGITRKSATVSWLTDRPSDSEAEYWSTNKDTGKSALGILETRHSLTLNLLHRRTRYNLRVKSTDAEGNEAVSPELEFTTAADGSFPLVLPRFTAGQDQRDTDFLVGIALANLSQESAALTITAMEEDGNLTAAQGISNPVIHELVPQAQLAILDWELFGRGFADLTSGGWIKFEAGPAEINGLFQIFDSRLNLMDGAILGDMPLTDFVITEIVRDGHSRVSLVNNNAEDAAVDFDLVRADGTIRNSGFRIIPGNGSLAMDLFGDLFKGLERDPAEYVRVRSGRPLHSFQIMREKEADISLLSGQDITAGGTTSLLAAVCF